MRILGAPSQPADGTEAGWEGNPKTRILVTPAILLKEANVVLKFNRVNIANDYLYLNEKQMEKLKKNRAKGKGTLIRFSLDQMPMQLQPPPPPPPQTRQEIIKAKTYEENKIFHENFNELLNKNVDVNQKSVKISNLFIKNIKNGASAFPGGINDVNYAIRYWIPEGEKN